MRVILVGLGSIGKRHLGNIRALEPDADIVVLRHSKNGDAVPEGANGVVYSLDDAIAHKPDVAFICGPTAMHADVGSALADAGAHLFVEKPFAADVAGGQMLVKAAQRTRRAVVVGYNLRFLPSLRALRSELSSGSIGRVMTLRAEVGQYLPDWRPGADYRQTNSARAEFGGGVELELSHEIDYVRWLLGEVKSVSATLERLSDLQIEVDDTAELLLCFASGSVASVHMDMAQRTTTRTCRIAGTQGTLTWDGIAGVVRRYLPEGGWQTIHVGDADRNAMYVDEVRHVFACARGEAQPLIDAHDGLRVVEIAQAARRSSNEGRRIDL